MASGCARSAPRSSRARRVVIARSSPTTIRTPSSVCSIRSMKADAPMAPGRRDSFRFEPGVRDPAGRARTGTLTTPHGQAKTPAFMAVGTAATVKALTPEQIARTGTEIVLCNTYHLAVRPGEDVIEAAGGLHSFMG